jgi:hypothetical protein
MKSLPIALKIDTKVTGIGTGNPNRIRQPKGVDY